MRLGLQPGDTNVAAHAIGGKSMASHCLMLHNILRRECDQACSPFKPRLIDYHPRPHNPRVLCESVRLPLVKLKDTENIT